MMVCRRALCLSVGGRLQSGCFGGVSGRDFSGATGREFD